MPKSLEWFIVWAMQTVRPGLIVKCWDLASNANTIVCTYVS